ncbi:MAG: trypsin-like peptidase domain-containing protein [Bacteroides sp.]
MNSTNIDYSAVVKVITNDGSGSGFFFRRPNYLMTNFHVVEGHRTVTLELQNEERSKGSVVLVSQHLDLAIIQAETDFNGIEPVVFCDEDSLELSDKIVVAGFPLGRPFAITEGIVSSPRQKVGARFLIQTDAAVNPGNSGGAMFNSEGHVCAVTVSKMQNAENIGFGIPVADIKKMLQTLDTMGDDRHYHFQCPGCEKAIVDDNMEYCDSCGAKIPQEAFKEVPKSALTSVVEKIISDMGIDPIEACNGDEQWKFYYKGALIITYVYNRDFLISYCNINLLPKQDLGALFEYLLKDPAPPYQFGVKDNDVVMYLCVHLSDLQNDTYREKIMQQFTALPEKAAELDDELASKYGCTFPERKNKTQA